MNENTPFAVLVTGAAKRIGRAVALHLAAKGWAVAVHYDKSEDAARRVVEEITDAGGRAAAVAADLAHEEEVTALIDRSVKAVGPLTCLVNNASVFENDTVETATRDSWDRHMEINLRAPFVLIQDFVRQIPPGAAANVINIIDQRVWNLTPMFTSYTLSKAALWTLTRTTALALAPQVRVNAIGPGPVLPSPRQTEEDFARQWKSVPLRRPATPEEIGQTVQFILDAPAMTGQMIALDGGQHLGWAQRNGGVAEE